jgi:anti-sigma28 factor (negative regulator of flagellin synthesis)
LRQQVNILLPYHDDAACAYSETNERKAIVKYTNPAEAENHYLTLHPNPADKIAIIELNQLTENITEVLVYDIAGKKIENIQWQKIENGKASIDISHLANGYYTCIAKTNTNKAYYGKLAKQ